MIKTIFQIIFLGIFSLNVMAKAPLKLKPKDLKPKPPKKVLKFDPPVVAKDNLDQVNKVVSTVGAAVVKAIFDDTANKDLGKSSMDMIIENQK